MTFRVMGDTPFYVIEIRGDEIAELLDVLQTLEGYRDVLSSVRVGIDFGDEGLKFSVNGSTWSRPIKGRL